jgi:FAD/FMN-containing dehydrogenase
MKNNQTPPAPADVLGQLRAILGERGLLTEEADCAPYCTDWRGLYKGKTAAVLRPASVAELSAAVRLCHSHDIPLVPQGGNTGLVGGAVPSSDGHQLIVSLGRMTRVRAVDPVDMVLEVDAGVTLAQAREAAAEQNCMLPLTIASEGTAQIGGVLATNAGGNNTVRYGNARDLLLGLEVVLADGRIWNGMRRLHKDNTGYSLRHLFVGSEGTLGIISGAVLKLVPAPRCVEVAFCSLPSVESAVALFRLFKDHDATAIQAFEYMSAQGLELVLRHIPSAVRPLQGKAPHYVLVELATTRKSADLRGEIEQVLGEAFEAGLVEDAVISQSDAQRKALWLIREEHSEAQRLEGASIKNDVSVPVSRIARFLAEASAVCQELCPSVRVAPFGHIGDGNIHFNLIQAPGEAPEAFLGRSEELMLAVNRVVESLGGSFSAEHGIGKLKTTLMPAYRGGAELDVMHQIKQALDGKNLLNPGKVLPRS